MSMGNWKSKLIRKQGKRSFTKSNRAKLYALYPPKEGWKPGKSVEEINAQGTRGPI